MQEMHGLSETAEVTLAGLAGGRPIGSNDGHKPTGVTGMLSDEATSNKPMLNRLDVLANEALTRWELPAGAHARLINLSENATYLVGAPCGFRSILRVHREGYHSRNAIACELEWLRALKSDGGVLTPDVIAGRDGELIQTCAVSGLAGERHTVMFAFIEGSEPDPDHDLARSFEELGEIAARTHLHSQTWPKPEGFERLVWDVDAVFGSTPTWGNWRDGPNVDGSLRPVLEKAEEVIRHRLHAFGKDPDRYGLIHADMRLANLLIDNGVTRLIDFDDCGFSWFLYDFAATISFIEDHPQVPRLKEAWVRGYRKVRALSAEEEAELDTFIMLRRMALLAWIGSHAEVPYARELSPHFAQGTAKLAQTYLSRFS